MIAEPHKEWLVTYTSTVGLKLSPLGMKRHAEGCHHLRPNANKPNTGRVKATPAEMTAHEPCKTC